MPRSVTITPGPLQFGQAPSEFALNRAGLTPFALANALRIGFEQPRVRRRVAAAGAADGALVDGDDTVAACDRAVDERALARACDAGDDGEHASGTSTSMPRRLCVRAARSPGPGALPHRLLDGVSVVEMEAGQGAAARSPSTVPSKTTSPPRVPARGPRSTMWSAMAIVSGLCSTTRTVLPLSRSCRRSAVHLWMSWGCRPMVGSSKT